MNVTTTQRWGYNNGDVTVDDVGQLKRANSSTKTELGAIIQFELCRVLVQHTSDRFYYCTKASVICKRKKKGENKKKDTKAF